MLKRTALVFSASMLATAMAHAADVEQVVPAYDWSGFYAGLHAGYAWSDWEITDPRADSARFDFNQTFNVDGGLFGVEIGANYQIDSIVIGIAADAAITGADDDTFQDVIDEDEIYVGAIDWLGTVRAKLGFAMDDVLIYGTGGLAVTEAEYRYENYEDGSQTELTGLDKASETLWGWTAGAGIEWRMTERMSLKAEYLYIDFETFETNVTEGGEEADIDMHVARGGVNFYF